MKKITINPNRIGLDEAYMQMAEVWAKRSKANRAQVGAILVKDEQICSDGYNGMPRNWNDDDDDVCETYDESGNLVTKKALLHAESNLLMKLARNGGAQTNGSTLYVTLAPCEDCAKLICQAGIARVVYRTPYRLTNGIDFLKKANIQVCQLPYIGGK